MNIVTEHYDWWRRPDPKPYVAVEYEILTEQAHVPMKALIRSFKDAGIRLADYRKEMYDFFNEPVPEDAIDPTRAPGFDLADASELMRSITPKATQSEADLHAIQREANHEQSNVPDAPEQAPGNENPVT